MPTSLGIDLAAQPANTAACLVGWVADGAEVLWVRARADCDDDRLVEWMAAATDVGIDAPFGWPATFTERVADYAATGRWPLAPRPAGGRLVYDELRYRETDRAVNRLLRAEHDVPVWPLSVSSDAIAVVAWRCASLLHRHAERTGTAFDRTGERSRVFETYPAAALAAWGLPFRRYKARTALGHAEAEAARERILAGIERASRRWLHLERSRREELLASDHALDAFLGALVARAAAVGATAMPAPSQERLARTEGWIHVPDAGALEALGVT